MCPEYDFEWMVVLKRVIKSIKMSLKLMLKLGLDQENVKKGLKMLLR